MPTINLTDRGVKALPAPAAGRVVHFDGSLSGFGVRVTAAGSKTYVAVYRVAGRQRWHTIGAVDKVSLADARATARKVFAAVARGEDPAGEKQAERSAPTVADLCARYLIDHAETHKRECSIAEDRSMIDRTIRPKLGNMKVTDVEREHIEALHRSLKPTPYRANRLLSLLSKMFALAEAWRLRPQNSNPAHGVRRFHEERRERWLTADELARLTEVLDAHRDQDLANIIRLLLLTGARRGEVLAATWDQFDFERGIWTKPSSHTKQKRTEHVPLSSAALTLLAGMKTDGADGLLFPGPTGKPRVAITKAWYGICRAAGIEGARIHDLRHTFASHLVSSGVSLAIVGRLLGHTQVATTERYSHVAADPQRQATDRFGDMVTTVRRGAPGATVVPLKG